MPYFADTYLFVGQRAFAFAEIISRLIDIVIYLDRDVQLFTIMEGEGVMVRNSRRTGIKILPFVEIGRVEGLACLDIGRSFAYAEASSAGPVPGFQDRLRMHSRQTLTVNGGKKPSSTRSTHAALRTATAMASVISKELSRSSTILKVLGSLPSGSTPSTAHPMMIMAMMSAITAIS